jgi:hypothetical protein
LEDNTEEDEMEITLNPSVMYALDKQLFKRYKTVLLLKEYHALGLPLSFVIADIEGVVQIGFVVGNGKQAQFIPLQICALQIDSAIGFPYFQTKIVCNDGDDIFLYSLNEFNVSTQHYSVVNYGHLLPHLATIDSGSSEDGIPYAIITTDANHMDNTFNFV